MKFLLVHFVLVVGMCVGLQAKLNLRPIVGILTQPTDGVLTQFGSSYIAASYVKYIESAGGRVVPIFHNSTTRELDSLFNHINAILFPGGGADLSPDTEIFKTGKYLYDKALNANNMGDFFPVFGHCMGFELLALITSQDPNILSGVDAEDITLPLYFTSAANTSRWVGTAPKDIINILTTKPVTMNNHVECVSPGDFANNQYLPSFYSVLATNVDRKNKEFISLWEGIDYPVYGMQWHAEKPQFEWNPKEVINHTPDAIRAMQYFSNYLVNHARKSMHHYPNLTDEYAALIYNYDAMFTQELTGDFQQCYLF